RRAVVTILERARTLSEARKRPARERHEFVRWLLDLTNTTGGDALYPHYAPARRAQLERDSGYNDYVETSEQLPHAKRRPLALARAAARYAETPAVERVYAVDEAISSLMQFVLSSTVIATRTANTSLYATLPAVLDPFAGLSPTVDAARQLVLA